MSFDQLLANLSTLTQDQLRQVKARVDLLLPHEQLSANDWLTAGILEELKRRGLHYKVWKSLVPKNYASDVAQIQEQLLRQVPKLTPTQQYAFGRVVARALADYIAKACPLGMKSMLGGIKQTLAAVEASYPGYMEVGMLGVLIDPYTTGIPLRQAGGGDE